MKIRNKMKICITSNMFIGMMLIVVLYYFSYRYIFQWANDITSGTYNSTPFVIQILKYVIVSVLLISMAFYYLLKRGSIRMHGNDSLIIFFLLLVSCYDLAILKDQGSVVLFMGLSEMMMIHMTKDHIVTDSIDRLVNVFFVYCTIYEIIQLFLYFYAGRLPAIAWGNAGIFYVRFGGAFDDPFAFSIMLAFLIPYVYYKYQSIKKYIYCGLLMVFLVMTWTMTTSATIIGAILFTYFYSLTRSGKMKLGIALLSIIAIIGGLLFFSTLGIDIMQRLFQVKSGSISEHIASVNLEGITASNFWGIIPKEHYSEASFIKMIFQSGIIYTLGFYSFGIYCVRVSIKNLKMYKMLDKKGYELLYGMAFYQACFLIASTNIPYVYQFMPMLLYSIFVGIELAIKYQIRSESL